MEKTNREDEEEDNDNEKKNMLTHLDKSVVLGSWHTTTNTIYLACATHQSPYLTTQFKKTKRKIENGNTVKQIDWQILSIIWSFHLVELHLQFNVLDSSR